MEGSPEARVEPSERVVQEGMVGVMSKGRAKLALVCTGGGHFEQMINLESFYKDYPRFWITSFGAQTGGLQEHERVYFIKLGHFKKPWTYLGQVPKLFQVYLKERPTHIISTGSGRIALFPYLLSLIFRAKFIHIETFSHVHKLTKMGMLLAKLGCPIYTQWPDLVRNGLTYIGPVFRDEPFEDGARREGTHVFVTLGTRDEPFPRIIRAVETLVREGVIQGRVVVQAGRTEYRSESLEIFDFDYPPKIDRLISDARLVVTQESAGIVTKCLKHRIRFVVMPREYGFGELPAKSDMNEDLHFKLEELGFTFVVRDVEELRNAIENVDKLKVGFVFDNSRAVTKLRRLIET